MPSGGARPLATELRYEHKREPGQASGNRDAKLQ